MQSVIIRCENEYKDNDKVVNTICLKNFSACCTFLL